MDSTTLNIATAPWFIPFCKPARYKGAHGGRGSGKSHTFAEAMIEAMVVDADIHCVCLREVQKSIKFSVKRLLELKIKSLGVEKYFEIQDTVIKRIGGTGIIIFQGMQNHTADSIKSLEGFDIAWVEEAQNLSQRSLDLLRPTIRKEGSEIWFTWNPRSPKDPVDKLLRGQDPPPDSIVAQVNFKDNPWFPDVLRIEMEYDRGRDIDKHSHVWLGGYEARSESRVFRNWKEEEFETDREAMLRFGADWGYAVDPTVLIRCYIVGRTLYIDYEAYKVKCEIEDTPALFMTVPESERWPIIADGARPETISHMKNNGFPNIMKAVKGSGSVEDGVVFLQTYDIIVHPRCVHTIDELTNYKWKVDPLTEEILPILEDKNNHVMDALRYACEGARRAKKAKADKKNSNPIPFINFWK